jgi:hypothetical protein
VCILALISAYGTIEQTLFSRRFAMLKYTGVNHLAMATGDMDGTIRF